MFVSMENERKDEDLEGSMLMILKMWAHRGVSRETFYQNIRGLNYNDMRVALSALEEKGDITVELLDRDRFLAYITESGLQRLGAIITDEECDLELEE